VPLKSEADVIMNKEWFNLKDISITDKLSDKNMLYDLQRLLSEELAKPLEERDLDAVKEITDAMVGINDEEIPKPVQADAVLAEVRARKRRSRIVQLRKWAAVLSACFAVCIALNFYTIRTYGSNVVETVIRAAKSGFSIDLKDIDDMEQPPAGPGAADTTTTTTTTDLYHPASTTSAGALVTGPVESTSVPMFATTTTTAGMQQPATTTSNTPAGNFPEGCNAAAGPVAVQLLEKAEQSGINTGYPQYLPDYLSGLKLTESSSEHMKDSADLYLTFSDGSSSLDIIVEEYRSQDDMPEVMVPSENFEYDVINSGYAKGFLIREDSGSTALFVSGNIVYTLHSSDIDPDELMAIAESFVAYHSGSSEK